MGFFLVKRLLTLIITLVATSVIVFAVLEILPGNAAQVLMGPDADPAAVAAKAVELGLDQPALSRYLHWIGGLLRGDMGLSYAYGSSVAELIGERLQLTVPLAVLAMALTALLALAVGVYAASQHNKAGDTGLMALAQLGIAVPNFWFAILLILLFSVKLQWFSAGGFDGWVFDDGVWAGLWDGLKALILPAVALAVVQAAILARFTRSAVLEVLREDFVRTARAKGLSRRATLWGHVLRNAMIPVITVMGLQFAELLAGTIVVESVFYLPGLGRLIFQSIANRDLIVVRNCVMLLAGMVVVVNFIVDVLYAVIDPRVKASEI
ncbi:MAG: ABC transporter permease [Burkholderiaceae bacterium]|nr:ABC transporter permease [Pseudomonadota bacterium]MBS0597763.1 ABC transporter permease [Pseudomonadota bacterium]MCO5115884.1 ABC transporter permease [Burkholderiaceae bacterium]MCP5219087.1 ABC transporter permease [Burkholderiaceae bacterium]